MNTRACIVAPRDLLESIISSNQKSGWFGGSELKSEQVLVVFKCLLNNEEAYSVNSRLLPHRASDVLLGVYKEQLLQWFIVERGFQEKYSGYKVVTREEFQSVFGIEFSGGPLLVSAIEPGPKGPILTAIDAKGSGDKQVRFRPIDSIIQDMDATPFARLSKDLVQDLKQKSAMIVGVGSGGSEIALNLACSGVGSLELLDPDRIRPENYIRFPSGRTDLGRYKVEAVKSLISERELPT